MDEWMDEWMDGRNKCCTSIRRWQLWMQCMESLFIPSQDWDCICLGSVAFVLTLHFCITLYVLPPPPHTHTCSQTTLSAEVTFQWLKVAYKYPIILTPFFNILFISRQTFIFEYVNSSDSANLLFLCRFQILLLLTQMSRLVFFWGGDQHLPRVLSIPWLHSPSTNMGKSAKNMNLKATSIRRQSRASVTKRAKTKKTRNSFLFTAIYEDGLDVQFNGIEADRLFF